MSRILRYALAGLCALAQVRACQGATQGGPPAFEVASIRPSAEVTPAMIASGRVHVGMRIDAARVYVDRMSLLDLMCKAYDLKPYQADGPDWMKGIGAPRFDIVAKMPPGAGKEQVPLMLQALLAERFKLSVHRESKGQKVLALVAGKSGPQLKEAAAIVPPADPAAPGGASGSGQVTIQQKADGAVMSDGKGGQSTVTWSADHKTMRIGSSRITMDQLAEALTAYQDRPVLNQTGLDGAFQVALDLSTEDLMNAARRAGVAVPPAAGQPDGPASDPGEGSLQRSLHTLGLKLEPREMALERIVVDHAEKMPTEN